MVQKYLQKRILKTVLSKQYFILYFQNIEVFLKILFERYFIYFLFILKTHSKSILPITGISDRSWTWVGSIDGSLWFGCDRGPVVSLCFGSCRVRMCGSRAYDMQLQMCITHSHRRTAVRECCKGDDASQWENWKFDPLPRPNPLTDRHKKLHT